MTEEELAVAYSKTRSASSSHAAYTSFIAGWKACAKDRDALLAVARAAKRIDFDMGLTTYGMLRDALAALPEGWDR